MLEREKNIPMSFLIDELTRHIPLDDDAEYANEEETILIRVRNGKMSVWLEQFCEGCEKMTEQWFDAERDTFVCTA